MTRSVRLYTAAQFEEVNTLVDLVAERSDLPPAERDRLTAFQADLRQTVPRPLADALTFCDMTTSPDGEQVHVPHLTSVDGISVQPDRMCRLHRGIRGQLLRRQWAAPSS